MYCIPTCCDVKCMSHVQRSRDLCVPNISRLVSFYLFGYTQSVLNWMHLLDTNYSHPSLHNGHLKHIFFALSLSRWHAQFVLIALAEFTLRMLVERIAIKHECVAFGALSLFHSFDSSSFSHYYFDLNHFDLLHFICHWMSASFPDFWQQFIELNHRSKKFTFFLHENELDDYFNSVSSLVPPIQEHKFYFSGRIESIPIALLLMRDDAIDVTCVISINYDRK